VINFDNVTKVYPNQNRPALESVDIEPLTEALAKRAGEAIAAVSGATLIDAVVMASAASRGDIVYSSDVEDLERLRKYFPGVRVLRT